MPFCEIEEYLDWLDNHAPDNRECNKPPTKLYLLIVLTISLFCSQADAARQRQTIATTFTGPNIRTLEADVYLTIDGEEVESTTLTRNATITYEATIGRREKLQSLEMDILQYSQGNYFWNNIINTSEPQDLFISLFLDMPELEYRISVQDVFSQYHTVIDTVEIESLLDYSSLTVSDIERERMVIDSNGRRDFWHLYNIEGPTLSGPVELYHSMLGGKEVILTLEEFGYLPVENITLVSPRINRHSVEGIPEPSTLALVVLGLMAHPAGKYLGRRLTPASVGRP